MHMDYKADYNLVIVSVRMDQLESKAVICGR